MASDPTFSIPQRDSPDYDRLVARRFCVLRNGKNSDIVYDAMREAYAGTLVEPAIVKKTRDARDRHGAHEALTLIGSPAEEQRETLRKELNELAKDTFADFVHLKLGKILQLHDGSYRLNLALSEFGLMADNCQLKLDCRQALNTDSIIASSTISGNFLRNRIHGLYAAATRFENCDLRNTLVNDSEFTSEPGQSIDAIPAGTELKRTEFHHCDFRDSYFTNSTFRNCVFKDCDLSHARFKKCTFENCIFDGVTLDNTVLEQGCNITGQHSNLEGITLKNVHLLIDVTVDPAIAGEMANAIRTKKLPAKHEPAADGAATAPPTIVAATSTQHQGDAPVSAATAAKARWDRPVTNPAAEAGSGHVDQLIEQSGGTVVDMSKWKR